MTGYSSARTPILGEMYIYNYILSVTTIPTVGVYSSSDKKTIATFPAFQDDLLKC